MQSGKDRPILQVKDFVKVFVDGELHIAHVQDRVGNYALLSNGVRFHVLDDKTKKEGQWAHRLTGYIIELA